MTKTDKQQILEYLQTGRTLTALDAWKEFNILTSLRSRVSDLRRDGYNIQTTMVNANGKSYAEYKLIKEVKQLEIF